MRSTMKYEWDASGNTPSLEKHMGIEGYNILVFARGVRDNSNVLAEEIRYQYISGETTPP